MRRRVYQNETNISEQTSHRLIVGCKCRHRITVARSDQPQQQQLPIIGGPAPSATRHRRQRPRIHAPSLPTWRRARLDWRAGRSRCAATLIHPLLSTCEIFTTLSLSPHCRSTPLTHITSRVQSHAHTSRPRLHLVFPGYRHAQCYNADVM